MVGELIGALISTSNVLDYVRLQPPTFINIGVLQIANEPTSKEIESFLDDSSPYGANLFTMGFIFDPSVVPIHISKRFCVGFGSLRQNIIVKFGGTSVGTDYSIRKVCKIILNNNRIRGIIVSAVGVPNGNHLHQPLPS